MASPVETIGDAIHRLLDGAVAPSEAVAALLTEVLDEVHEDSEIHDSLISTALDLASAICATT